jgi:ribonuclease-3
LGNDIVMGGGEAQSGGRNKIAILSDVAEAVIGAVYRDGGYAAARDVVRSAWSAHLDMPAHAELRDPKTALQEWAQARGMAPPVYTVVQRRGPEHAPEFVVRVEVPGHDGAEGTGPSKRLAEQVAARAMLAIHMPRSHA